MKVKKAIQLSTNQMKQAVVIGASNLRADGGPGGSSNIPVCGNGLAALTVEGKFLVTVEMYNMCRIYNFASDYSFAITGFRDDALAAIVRAEKDYVP